MGFCPLSGMLMRTQLQILHADPGWMFPSRPSWLLNEVNPAQPSEIWKQITKKAAQLQANSLQIHNKRTSSLWKDRKDPLYHAQMPLELFLLFPDFYPSEKFVSLSHAPDMIAYTILWPLCAKATGPTLGNAFGINCQS